MGSRSVTCAVRGIGSVLYGININDTLLASAFQNLGAQIVDDPSCGGDPSTVTAICAVKGLDNALYGIRFGPPSNTSGVKPLGGIIADQFSCAVAAQDATLGNLICAAKGTDNNLYGIRFVIGHNSTTFSNSGFQFLGGSPLTGNPACATAGLQAGVACLVRGAANSLFAVRFDPGASFSTGLKKSRRQRNQ